MPGAGQGRGGAGGELTYRLEVWTEQQDAAGVRRRLRVMLRAVSEAETAADASRSAAADGPLSGAPGELPPGGRPLDTLPRGGRPGALPPGGLSVLIAADFAQDRVESTLGTVAAAIGALPDGARFAVLEHDRHGAPRDLRWRTADTWERERAEETANWLRLSGSPANRTSYGGWLERARKLFAETAGESGPGVADPEGGGSGTAGPEGPRRQPSGVRHLLMITDGSAGRSAGLSDELEACAPHFTCDVLGVGDGWQPELLREIATRLHGTAAWAAPDDGLPRLLGRTLGRLARTRAAREPLRVTLRAGVRLVSAVQAAPDRRPLPPPCSLSYGEHGGGGESGEGRAYAFMTKLWQAGETRDYELVLSVDPTGDPLDEELQLAVVGLGGAEEPALTHWSDGSTRWGQGPGGGVRHGNGAGAFHGRRTELIDALLAGCKAAWRGERPAAEQHLGRAAQLAHVLDDTDFMAQVRMLAEVLDASAGVVRLRASLDAGVLLGSQLSAHRAPAPPSLDEPGGRSPGAAGTGTEETVRACGGCGSQVVADSRFCVHCGRTP